MNPFSGTHRRPRGIRSSTRAGGIDDVARHTIWYSSGVGPRPACHRTGRLPRIMSALLLILLVNQASALAQLQTGEVFGRVVDETGAVLAGARVTLTGPALMQPRVSLTTATGAYRFPSLPIGVYDIKFEMSGFAALLRQQIKVDTGFNAEVNAVLRVPGVEEAVSVSGLSPIIDTKATSGGATFSREVLERLPSARDPWAVIEQTPGAVMSVQNVGGRASGQQYEWMVRGTGWANAMWNVDGATITDMSDKGSAPLHFDFDSFQEVRIQTGGNDASLQTGGVNINVVTKSGGNVLRGTGRLFVADDAFQWNNMTAELETMGAGAGNPLRNVSDYGVEVGGPVVRNRSWFWGALGGQHIDVGTLGFYKPGATDPSDPDSLESDLTTLWLSNLKWQWQPSAAHRLTIHVNYGTKHRPTRGGGPTRPLETTVRQDASAGFGRVSHQWAGNSRLVIDTQAIYVHSAWVLDFHSAELADVQRAYDIATGRYSQSFQRSQFTRPSFELKTDFAYLSRPFLGGDHSMKFGVGYRNIASSTARHVGGGVTARFRNGLPVEADVTRDENLRRGLRMLGAYASDSYNRGRLHLNIGVRADWQKDRARSSSAPASEMLPDLLPPVDFEGAEAGVHIVDVSPRLGLTYDLDGEGRTVVKASLARYHGQGINTADTINPVIATTLRYPWRDMNGDRVVQRDELDCTRLLWYSSNYDPAHPDAPMAPNKVDSNLKSDRTDEAVIGLERQMLEDFAVGVSYVWRRYDRFAWTPRIGLTSADYVPVTYTAICGNESCDQRSYRVTYYQLPFQIPATSILTNQDYDRSFNGIEATARKRLSSRWLMNASLAFSSSVAHYRGPQSYQDPTIIPFADNAQYEWLNARWVLKLSGTYSFPWGVNTSAFLNARQGYPRIGTIQSPWRTGSIDRVNVPLKKYGEERYPAMVLVDVRAEKWLTECKRLQVALSLDVFNLGNANTVLEQETRQNLSTANNVVRILAPRVARIGIRAMF